MPKIYARALSVYGGREGKLCPQLPTQPTESTKVDHAHNYLVAPSMGGGLDVQNLITDGSGNLLSNYIYAGAAPIMRLDAAGNPVYYLTDGMGSVIELADSSGETIAEYDYDGFGNLRGTVGHDAIADTLGGDFRFQGHWLESESGLYYMRARDYDSHSGRFISRDPVDIIETEPESFNPYQFVYNNPYIYSDPTGMFTMIEINTSLKTQDILRASQQYVTNQAKEYFVDAAKGLVRDLFQEAFRPLLPNFWMSNILDNYGPSDQGNIFESFVKDQICRFFGGRGGSGSLFDRLWLTPFVGTDGGEHPTLAETHTVGDSKTRKKVRD